MEIYNYHSVFYDHCNRLKASGKAVIIVGDQYDCDEVKKWTWFYIKYIGKERKIGKRLDYFLIYKKWSEI